MKLGILVGFGVPLYEKSYQKACEVLSVDYTVINLDSPSWMAFLKEEIDSIDGFVAIPPCSYQELKTIYDERLFIIDQYFKKPIFPNFKSCYIYENKRNMASFLEYYNFPHANTKVFIHKEEALSYLKTAVYPLVVKANIGAGGRAVNIVKSFHEAKRIVNDSFGWYNGMFCTGSKTILHKYGLPIPISGEGQRHFIIVQDYYQIKWEWRVLKIGDYYFGHQKLLKGEKASGSGLVGWVMPPFEVLNLAKDVCDKGGFDIMDVDIFETTEGLYLVNELQAQFGSYLDYQMRVDDKPGRLVYSDSQGFVWEEGVFNQLNSCLLKVSYIKSILQQNEFKS